METLKHCLLILALSAFTGCASTEKRCHSPESGHGGQVTSQRSDHSGTGTALHRYQPQAGDPPWLMRVGEFHGHLGPWVVLGAMVGRDALRRLETSGYWDIDITVFSERAKQRQPWSCILDGLQVSTGATLGKCNIRFSDLPREAIDGRTVVQVRRLSSNGSMPPGYAYRVSDKLLSILKGMTPDQLEGLSRHLASERLDTLFEIRALSRNELPVAPQASHSD